MNNLCTNCKHSLSGHPRWASHYRSCNHPNVTNMEDSKTILGLEIEQLGIDGGWFHFPFNFDPNWLKSCQGYEARLEGD